MKNKITLLSLLISTQLFAQDKLNIYPNVAQHVFEKQISAQELEIELPDSYHLNSFYIEDSFGIIPKFYDFKNKSENIFKENSEVMIAGQKYKFKSLLDNKLIVLDDNNKINVFNFNNLNSFNFNQNYETNKNSIHLYQLKENEKYSGSYLFGNVNFEYKKNLTIDDKTMKGYLNTEFVIINNTDQDLKNVETSIMFEKINLENHILNRRQEYQEQEIVYSKAMIADNIKVEDTIMSEKKNVLLGIVDIPANKTKVIKHIDNINFDFIYSYDFNISFDKKESVIYPNYSLSVERNKENEKLFDIEEGQGYIYDKKSRIIINNLYLNKSEDKKLLINLGKSNKTKLNIKEDFKFNILNPEEVYIKENYYKPNIEYIESVLNFENLKENSEINLITNNIYLLKNKINEEELKFFKDKLILMINTTTKNDSIREDIDKLLRDFLKDKLISNEDYKKSENYKNGKIFVIKYR